ncbi:tryptophan--tRNA ligase [Falsirhodobacter halotolerans]|uniref:tryptophan--tRNA ligase n=1 Tax=Falsirhodobacter halotolerans TaxID=1146892 RepID=UPI001FD27DD8|nr:tryptophan--tRNA ligase [Falsirhodobacter halotolerans]MCJ8138680.1 tryptophan--tRNA ligase [Falsirhodobacter halotolerans]
MAEPVQTPQAFPTRIFSGIQPSGSLTLGNYLGALKRFAQKQDEGIETLYCVVDLHAVTVWQDPARLRQQTREIAASYIASGVDPKRSILYNQSQVTAHAELGWLLSCVARIGWMYRMTQFKDKSGANAENASLGLLAYPALMAADILSFRTTHVPVGEDQKQHIELARDIAAKFNHDYKTDFFPIPEPLIEGPATRVMSLRDGTKKMSKSDPSDASRINLTDDADTIAKKIRKAKTDAEPLPDTVEGLEGRPDAKNLVNIYAALADLPLAKVMEEFAGAQFGTFKPALADLAVAKLGPITAEMNRLMAEPDEIDAILGRGAERADAIARPIVAQVYDIMGMIRSRQV